MSAFVEECRREWKRLGVPDLLAEEMATELESDLAEAEADGVSAAEILGESDPRRFAMRWASERGLVTNPAPKKSRRWIWVVVGLALAFVFVAVLGLFTATKVSVQAHVGSPPGRTHSVDAPPVRAVRVPLLVGLKACHAQRIALARGFHLSTRLSRNGCKDEVVVHQRPAAHAIVPRHTAVTLRLRG